MTDRERLGPDICAETHNQDTNIKDRILTIWYNKIIKQKKLNL